MRRAVAIQLIIQRELGIAKNENPLQGAYVIEELTDRVEEAVLARVRAALASAAACSARWRRSTSAARIQEESLLYESRKHSGELPIVGVNTFENPRADEAARPRAS